MTTPFLCPHCGSALGNVTRHGAIFKAGAILLTMQTTLQCCECGQQTVWTPSRPLRPLKKRKPPVDAEAA